MGAEHDEYSPHVYKCFSTLWLDNRDKHFYNGVPDTRTVGNTWNTFRRTGFIKGTWTGGPCKKYRDEVTYAAMTQPDVSNRQLSEEFKAVGMDISHSTIQRVRKKELKMHAYKDPLGQKLSPIDAAHRRIFADKMHRMVIEKKTLDVSNICFTDECMYSVGCYLNRQNIRHYVIKGDFDPYEYLKEREFQGFKTHVFCLISSKVGVIGPFFIEDMFDFNAKKKSLTSEVYIKLLDTKVIPELKSRLGDDFQNCWFQQDGAGVHRSKASLDYLRKTFGNRLISIKTKYTWAPKSPDMNPCDYWLWARSKQLLQKCNTGDEFELKMSISQVFGHITIQDCAKAISDFPIRIMALRRADGGHFEQTLQSFKLELAKLDKICIFCEEKHACPCPSCEISCCKAATGEESDESSPESDDGDDGQS